MLSASSNPENTNGSHSVEAPSLPPVEFSAAKFPRREFLRYNVKSALALMALTAGATATVSKSKEMNDSFTNLDKHILQSDDRIESRIKTDKLRKSLLKQSVSYSVAAAFTCTVASYFVSGGASEASKPFSAHKAEVAIRAAGLALTGGGASLLTFALFNDFLGSSVSGLAKGFEMALFFTGFTAILGGNLLTDKWQK